MPQRVAMVPVDSCCLHVVSYYLERRILTAKTYNLKLNPEKDEANEARIDKIMV